MKTTGEDAVKIDETTRKDLEYYKNKGYQVYDTDKIAHEISI